MTYLLKDIRDHLADSVYIADSVSDRIFADAAPQELRDNLGNRRDVYPCIVISEISNTPEYYLGGEAGLHTTTVQVDVYTDGTNGRQKLNEIGERVRNRLSGYRGQFGDGVTGTARLISDNSTAAQAADASDQPYRRQSMDFEIIHSAAVPDFA